MHPAATRPAAAGDRAGLAELRRGLAARRRLARRASVIAVPSGSRSSEIGPVFAARAAADLEHCHGSRAAGLDRPYLAREWGWRTRSTRD